MATSKSAFKAEILGEHLPYEIHMLQATHKRLLGVLSDQVVANALIESFCIHARQLIEFFENKQGCRAKEFTGGTYQAMNLSNLETQRHKLNTQIAHLTARRTADSRGKIDCVEREKLLIALMCEARNFRNKLVPPYAGNFNFQEARTLDVADSSLSVTDQTSSVTTTSGAWGGKSTES